MIDTGCKRSLDVIKYRFSLLEAESYRINCGICYRMILGKQILHFEAETDIYKKEKGAGNSTQESFNPQCWEAREDWGQ